MITLELQERHNFSDQTTKIQPIETKKSSELKESSKQNTPRSQKSNKETFEKTDPKSEEMSQDSKQEDTESIGKVNQGEVKEGSEFDCKKRERSEDEEEKL